MAALQVVTAALVAVVSGATTAVVEFGLILMACVFVFWCWAGPMVLGTEAGATRRSAPTARPGRNPPLAGYVDFKARAADADRCARPAELCRTVSRLATQLEDTQQDYMEDMFQRFLTQYAAREKSEHAARCLDQELDEARTRAAHLEQRNAELTRKLATAEADLAGQRRLVDPQGRAPLPSPHKQSESMDVHSLELETALKDDVKAHARALARHREQTKALARVKDKSRRRELRRLSREQALFKYVWLPPPPKRELDGMGSGTKRPCRRCSIGWLKMLRDRLAKPAVGAQST